MSRHTVHRESSKRYLVVGYDRPLDHWFLQHWDGKDEGSPVDSEIHHSVVDLFFSAKRKGFAIPAELCRALEKESVGLAETNTCKEWA